MTDAEALAVLDRTHGKLFALTGQMEADLTQARATLAAVVADAERYRFLKTNNIIRVFPLSSGMMSRGGSRILADTKDWLPGDFTYIIDGLTRDVDAAIDAAIAAMRGTTA